MDFVSELPESLYGYDSIWVIVNQMTRWANFLPTTTTDPVKKLARLYLKEIVWVHGVSVSMILDRDVKFTSIF